MSGPSVRPELEPVILGPVEEPTPPRHLAEPAPPAAAVLPAATVPAAAALPMAPALPLDPDEIARLTAGLRVDGDPAVPAVPWRRPVVAAVVGAVGVLALLLTVMTVLGSVL